MKYRLLNEVLIEWNESSKEDSDNIFLKFEDVKESLDRCFVYRLNEKKYIKIFDKDWPEYEKYRDKVWINGKHIKLDDESWTVDKFEPGEYRVYIEDIDKVTDTDSMFLKCYDLVSAFIPNSVTSISDYAFYDCSGLTRVTIPNSVASIGDYAFYGCTGLTSVRIPSSVTSIGNYAFPGCKGLTSVTIPGSVTKIGMSAFEYCPSLTSVTIPKSVTSIREYAFQSCENLKTVYVEDINKFNQIKFKNETADPRCYGAQLIELKK